MRNSYEVPPPDSEMAELIFLNGKLLKLSPGLARVVLPQGAQVQ